MPQPPVIVQESSFDFGPHRLLFGSVAGTPDISLYRQAASTLRLEGSLHVDAVVQASRLVSTVAIGTAPLTVTSTTMVANLNCQFLGGQDSAFHRNASNLNAGTIAAARLPAYGGDVSKSAGASNIAVLRVASLLANDGWALIEDGTNHLRPIHTAGGGTGYPDSAWGSGLLVQRTAAGTTGRGSFRFWCPANDTESLYFSRAMGLETEWGQFRRVWHAGQQGAGTGMDADLLDGQHGSYFLNTSANSQTKAGALTLNGNLTVRSVGTDGRTLSLGVGANGNAINSATINLFSGASSYWHWIVRGDSHATLANRLQLYWSPDGASWLNALSIDTSRVVTFDQLPKWGAADLLHTGGSAQTRTGTLIVGSTGNIRLTGGSTSPDPERPGYVGFHTADGTRRGYIGWGTGSNDLLLASENSWNWRFTQTPTVNGNHMWHSGNFDPGTKSNTGHTHTAAETVSGIFSTARLGSGTANSSTFLRGDGQWATTPASGGTVTSVSGSGGTTGLTLSGGPITTSGTLTLGGTLGVSNGGTGATTAAGARSNLGAAAASHEHSASEITSGTLASARLSGSYTGITGVGSLGSLTVGGATSLLGTLAVSNLGADLTSGAGYKLLMRADSGYGVRAITLSAVKGYLDVQIADVQGLQGALDAKAATGHAHAAADITSGTFASARLSGAYTGITGLGTISSTLTVTADISLRATNPGAACGHFAGWVNDPTTSGNQLRSRTAAQLLSDIGAASSGHLHDGTYVRLDGGNTISGNLGFGTSTRQMLGLYGTDYGLGVQSSTLYLRTASRLAVHAGGVHSNSASDPGSGGSLLMDLRSGGHFQVFGHNVWHAGNTHNHAASEITSGILATARLGSGTANSSTFLRGDGTWATPSGGSTPLLVASFSVNSSGTAHSPAGGISVTTHAAGWWEVTHNLGTPGASIQVTFAGNVTTTTGPAVWILGGSIGSNSFQLDSSTGIAANGEIEKVFILMH